MSGSTLRLYLVRALILHVYQDLGLNQDEGHLTKCQTPVYHLVTVVHHAHKVILIDIIHNNKVTEIKLHGYSQEGVKITGSFMKWAVTLTLTVMCT